MDEVIDLHGGGLSAWVLSLGAIIQDLRLNGVPFPLVLGSSEPRDYLGPLRHVGTMAGRYANRIANARFVLDGKEHRTDPNWLGKHTLHGGSVGTGQKHWRIAHRAAHRVTLALDLPDGDMGFPGNLAVQVTIRLGPGPVLSFDTEARSDRATPCSFTHHGYFSLDDTADLRHHRLRLAAAQRIEMDEDLIPTGRLIETALEIDPNRPLDHGFALRRNGRRSRPALWMTSTESNLALRVETTAPALQLHTDGSNGKMGIAIEAQEYPDAPNQPHFPDAILRPGARWRQRTRYVFVLP